MSDWSDHVVGDRMSVDQEFSDRVQASRFTSQEWGLIMTATELEIQNPGTDRAQVVANTENLPQMMPELETVRKQMPGPGGESEGGSSGSGVLDSIRDTLGISGDDGADEERLAEAQTLTQEYATEFQNHLQNRGKWEEVQELAMEDAAADDDAAGDDAVADKRR